MLFGSETWPVTNKLEDLLLSSDRRMIRLMCDVSLHEDENLIRESIVQLWSGGHKASDKEKPLLMFVHVTGRGEYESLGMIPRLEAPGRCPPGKPKNT